jgi:hypothetical protein
VLPMLVAVLGSLCLLVRTRLARASAYPLATVPVLSLLGVVGVHSVGRGVTGSR